MVSTTNSGHNAGTRPDLDCLT